MIRSNSCDPEKRRALFFGDGARLCFLGIGGVSMYALALLSSRSGAFVFGQDRVEGERTKTLIRQGVRVYIPEAGAAVDSATAVIASLSVDECDSDLCRARERGIPVFTRGELLGAWMKRYTTSVAVSGTHGKSTVTAALASVFSAVGRDPTVLAGANLAHSEEAFRIGGEEYLIAEACEYGDSFLSLRPSLSLFLNLEWDHPDYFPSEDALVRSFCRAAMGSGVVLYNADSPLLCRAIEAYGAENALSVGRSSDCDFCYEVVSCENARVRLRFWERGRSAVEVPLSVVGRFQAENAAMVLAAAVYLGIPASSAGAALSAFGGISRRLSLVSERGARAVYYDYAHHPTEIRASIETLRELCCAPITVLFRPHTFSRTEALFEKMASALSLADRLVVTDIDGAREREGRISAEMLARAAGGEYLPIASVEEFSPLSEGPIVLMGAGDLSKPLRCIVEKYGKKD